jgi:hypothetical protein
MLPDEVHAVADGPGFGEPLPEHLIQVGHGGGPVTVKNQTLGERFGLADAPVCEPPSQIESTTRTEAKMRREPHSTTGPF